MRHRISSGESAGHRFLAHLSSRMIFETWPAIVRPNQEAHYGKETTIRRRPLSTRRPATGLFTPDMESVEAPQAHGILTGRVIDTALRINPVTKSEFLWAKVQTFGGVFDVVADPLIVSGAVVEGGIIHGSFWLSGRLRNADGKMGLDSLRRFFAA